MEKSNGGSFLSRWLPALIALASGAGSAYAMLQVQQARLDYVITVVREHVALPGHPGITQRMDGIMKQMDDHQRADNEVNGLLMRRIEKAEDRLLDMERSVRRGRTLFQFSKEAEAKP